MTVVSRTLLLLILPAAGVAADKPDFAAAFPQLARKELRNEGVTLLYPSERAAAVSPPAWLAEYEAAGVYASAPLTLQLGELPPLTLICDSGPSADPSCRLLPDAAKPEQDVFAAPGTQFAFLADARIVVGGHGNTFYDERKLYEWKNGKFAEVVQPLRHVGITGTTREAVTLRRTPGGDILGIRIPAGARVSVLLHDTSRVGADGRAADYLLLTPEGLVGWAALPGRPDGTTDIDGLYYRGD